MVWVCCYVFCFYETSNWQFLSIDHFLLYSIRTLTIALLVLTVWVTSMDLEVAMMALGACLDTRLGLSVLVWSWWALCDVGQGGNPHLCTLPRGRNCAVLSSLQTSQVIPRAVPRHGSWFLVRMTAVSRDGNPTQVSLRYKWNLLAHIPQKSQGEAHCRHGLIQLLGFALCVGFLFFC